MSTTTGVAIVAPPRAEIASSTHLRLVFVFAQLVLAAVVIHVYAIEGPAFDRIFAIAAAGFAINAAVPRRYRLRFFVALSFSAVFATFGLADGAWLIAAGLTLIGLCHLPCPIRVRVAILIATASVLAVSRGGLIASPWSAAVWPILGAMFMFRLVLYMHALANNKAGSGPWNALAYFFMLPNLVFPLYPVVDYQTFRRTYYDKGELEIYERGLLWISRGVVHLLLYRFVYQVVLNDPADVVRLTDLIRFMLGTFLLYLRVSGQFHLIIGILHLFGFRLPETHKLYYLAHSFTELWRRINIYWTTFMMTVVFYPTYFKVKRFGPVAALVISTVAVFATTWILHSYQWFWLRGGFPLTLQDTLFWGILGALVVRGAVRESKAVKKPKLGVAGWSFQLGLQSALTFGAFCFLWSLWSAPSVGQWIWMLGAAANVDTLGVALLALGAGTLLLLGGRDWAAAGESTSQPQWVRVALSPATRTVMPLAVLLALAHPVVSASAPSQLAAGLSALHATGLNARDAALQHRGYYEQLDVRAQINSQVLDAVGRNGEKWDDPASMGILRSRRDLLERDLYPSKHVVWNGRTFTTNRWGMRDQEYQREKAAGTLRIAMLGPSHVMGNGVSDGETFESLLETRLNRDFRHQRYSRIEVLNFGVDGYTAPQQLAILEDRVLGFSPDVVIATHYHREREMTQTYLSKVVWGGIEVTQEPLRELLAKAGLYPLDRGGVPVPFAAGRRLARWAGLDPRMPSGEAETRVRWIVDDAMDWAFRRLASVTRSHGAMPIVLALNAVIEDAPPSVPRRAAFADADLPVIDLFGLYPEADRSALRVAPWDDHPNAAGHRLIADHLYQALVPMLERRILAMSSNDVIANPTIGGPGQ